MENKTLQMTVVIPTVNDRRVFRVVDQVLEVGAECLVVCNGSSDAFEDELRTRPICIESLPDANLSRALEVGVRAATYDKIVLMDSDCQFGQDTLAHFFQLLDEHHLVRGMCVFDCKDFVSRTIANVRTATTTVVQGAYKPPLGIARSALLKYLDYFFHPDILWCEDAEFDARRIAAGIDVHFSPEAIIYHDSLQLLSDLRSAARYGRGYARAELLGCALQNYDRWDSDFAQQLSIIERLYLWLFETVEKLSYQFWLRCDRTALRIASSHR
ncbi:MAG: glycosyltransferase [Oscillatoria sp. SIO1A7]|nr:glycosyltransferase [Oscillatoria sp. SIO1A7]